MAKSRTQALTAHFPTYEPEGKRASEQRGRDKACARYSLSCTSSLLYTRVDSTHGFASSPTGPTAPDMQAGEGAVDCHCPAQTLPRCPRFCCSAASASRIGNHLLATSHIMKWETLLLGSEMPVPISRKVNVSDASRHLEGLLC